MTLFGHRGFTDVFKLRQGFNYTKLIPKSLMTDILRRRGNFRQRDRDTQGEYHVKMEIEIRMTYL